MGKKGKGIVLGAGITATIIAAATTVAYAVSKYLTDVALNRELPKATNRMKKAEMRLKGSNDKQEFLEKINEKSEWLQSLDNEIVELTAGDGTCLLGHWIECENAERVIVAMHGWRSSWSNDFGMIAEFWIKNNCSILLAEQRGQGGSGGDYMGFGLVERYDCLSWVRWAHEKTEGRLPIYLGGVSMGAATVLMAAGFELPESVKGIIADCGFTSPHAIWKHVVDNNLKLNYGILSAIAEDMCRKKIQYGAKDYSAIDAMKECKIPVLFIHGTDDNFVPITMTFENYKACAAPKKLLVVPGADHAMSYLVDKEGYETAVKDFWEEFK